MSFRERAVRIMTDPRYIVAGVIAVTLLNSLYWFESNGDEAKWHYMGYAWAKFHLPPYRFTVDNKGPGIFILYALSSLVFGVNFLPVKYLGVAAWLIAAWLVYRIACVLRDRSTGLLALTLFGLTGAWSSVDGTFSSCTENFLVPCCAFAIWQVILAERDRLAYRRYLLAGLALGVAVAFKEIAITTIGAAGFWIFFRERGNWRRVVLGNAVLLMGVLASTALSVVPLLLSGATVHDYIEGAWLILFQHHISGAAFQALDPVRVDSFLKTWVNAPVRSYLPFVALFILARPRLLKNGVPYFPLLVWLLCEFIGVNASGVTHPHQVKQILPVLTIITALAIKTLLESDLFPARSDRNRLAAALGLVAVLCVPLNALIVSGKNLVRGRIFDRNPYYEEVGRWIRANVRPDQEIYVFGRATAALSMVYGERRSPSKHFTNSFIYGFYFTERDLEARDLLVTDLETRQPPIILVPDNFQGEFAEPPLKVPDWFQAVLDRSYQPEEKVKDYRVYRLRHAIARGN